MPVGGQEGGASIKDPSQEIWEAKLSLVNGLRSALKLTHTVLGGGEKLSP